MDPSRPPNGERQRQAILKKIVEGGDTAEKHYLEVKRELDFTSREETTKVAKFILGASNRLPSMATRSFGGFAVMVIGAEQGALPGVPAGTEILDIEQKINKFLQPDGPSWDLERAPADEPGREVLFIIVDPPQDGDGPFVCRADFQAAKTKGTEGPKGTNLADGEIYVRVQGETRKAKSSEVLALIASAGGGTKRTPELTVTLRGEAGRLQDSQEQLDRFTQASIAEAKLKYVRADSTDPDLGILSVQPSLLALGTRTSWSARSFAKRASEWEEEVRANWTKTVDAAAAAALPRVRIELGNLRPVFLEEVRFDLTLENAYGLDAAEPEDFKLDSLIPPVIKESDPLGLAAMSRAIAAPYRFTPQLGQRNHLTWKNVGSSLQIRVELDSLRPGTPWESDEDDLVIISIDGQSEISGSWKATVRGHHEVYEGALSLSAGKEHSFAALLKMLPE